MRIILFLVTLLYSIPVGAQQAAIFKDDFGNLFIYGAKAYEAIEVKITAPAGNRINRRLRANSCGFATIKSGAYLTDQIELPTIQGQRVSFDLTAIPQAQGLLCRRNVLYFPLGFDPKTAIANVSPNPTNPPTTTVDNNIINLQNAQPTVSKSGNYLIVAGIPPGTYIVSNATNLSLSRTYTVGTKYCLIADRTQIGTPNLLLINRQNLTFPINWQNLTEVADLPSC